jgi:hypothetical protein
MTNENEASAATTHGIRPARGRAASGQGRPWLPVRVGSFLVPVAAVVLGALVLLAPTAAGQTFGPLGFHGPPFKGSLVIGQGLSRVGCGATAKFLVPPTFSLKTGLGKVSSESSASGCGPKGLYDLGDTNSTLGFDSTPFTWSSPGPVPANITFNFSVTFVVNLTATLASPTGSPSAWAIGGVFVHVNIYDMTTGTWSFGPGSYPYLVSTNGSATGYVNQSWHNVRYNVTYPGPGIVSGDTYTIVIYATTLEIAYAPAHTATSATARLDMASGAKHFQVSDWTLA